MTGECDSLVTIRDDDSVPVVAVRSTQGSAGDSLVGKLQANQSYTLWASTRAASFQNVPGLNSSSGNDSLEMQFASGPITTPVIPEPGTWALCLAGVAGVALAVRRRRPH